MKLNTSSLTAGVVFVILGVVFLLDAIDVWELSPAYLWPVLLIGLGLVVALGGRTVGDERDHDIIR